MATRVRPPAIVGLSREIELLLCCARPHIGAEILPKIRALLQEPVDWGGVITAAVSQDVLPLVYHNLTTVCGAAVPEEMRVSLDRYVERNAARNARLARELVGVFHLLEARAIPALPFKGCVLAAAAYADPALREFQDLDFLIRRQDALRAKEALIAAGYQLDTIVKLNGFPAHGYEYRFVRDRDGLAVEVCWRITLRHSFASLDLRRLRGRGTLTLAGATVPTLTPEEQLLMVCVHGSKHVWLLVRWLCDVAALLDRFPGMNWEWVREQAREAGCWRAVALGLYLAHEWLGASLPAPVLRAIAREPGIGAAAGMVGERLFQGDGGIAAAAETRFHRYLAERLRDRLWIQLFPLVHPLYDLITPSERDRAALRLPVRLTGLYYALRPVRLLVSYGCAPVWKVLFRKAPLKPR
jgi:Uncharacterised nucleotidyltransferase